MITPTDTLMSLQKLSMEASLVDEKLKSGSEQRVERSEKKEYLTVLNMFETNQIVIDQ